MQFNTQMKHFLILRIWSNQLFPLTTSVTFYDRTLDWEIKNAQISGMTAMRKDLQQARIRMVYMNA